MLYLQRPPLPPLSAFVESLWYTCAYAPAHRLERVFPNGRIQLILNLAEKRIHVDADTREPALFTGIHSKCMLIHTADLAEMIGVQFRPAGFHALFKIPAHELTDQHIEFNTVPNLRNRLQEAVAPEAKLAIFEQALTSLAASPLSIHPAVRLALSQPSARIAAVARDAGLSPRRLTQLFRAQIGVTPKHFYRIARFQQTIQRLHAASEIRWAELALDCGYFDQAHFTHDFREFSGLTPSAYSGQAHIWMNHRPVI